MLNKLKSHQLDNIDKHILRLLQKDASISNLALSEKIGISPTPCARRVIHLEEQGFIVKKMCVVDQTKLGLSLTAYISVRLKSHTQSQFVDFEAQVLQFEEVIDCSVVTGRSEDYLLRVVIKDMKHYEDFLLNKVNQIKGVDNVHTSFELRNVRRYGTLPVD